MKKTMLEFLLASALGFGVGACGSNSSSTPSTLAGICNETGAAFCQSAVKCNPGSLTSSQCVAAFVQGCCQNDGTCNDPVSVDAPTYAQCKGELAGMTCANVSSATMPTSCMSI